MSLNQFMAAYHQGGLPRYPNAVAAEDTKRISRRPRHPFSVLQNPYEITPFFIAPVLPSETMEQAMINGRVVSPALKNRISGHWHETYLFYVPIFDLFLESGDLQTAKDNLVKMLIKDNQGGSPVPTASADNPYFFVKSGAPDWTKKCYDYIVKHFFRDEGEPVGPVGATSGLAFAQARHNLDVMQSLVMGSRVPAGDAPSGMASLEELYQAWLEWQAASASTFAEPTYNDYLNSFGVETKEEVLQKAEALRYSSHWAQPVNTVSSDGQANTQVLWSILDRADKRRRFRHPGFIMGVTVVKPKVFIADRQQSSVSLLHDMETWLPAALQDDFTASIITIDSDDVKNPYKPASLADESGEEPEPQPIVFDVRDLFMHGDEFIQQQGTSPIGAAPMVHRSDCRDVNGKKYPKPADLAGLYEGATQHAFEGVVTLNIKGRQRDTTP